MIRIFRIFHPLSVLPLLAVAILLNAFQWDVNLGQGGLAFQEFSRHLLLQSTNALLGLSQSKLIGFLILFSQALLFNKVVNDHNLLGKPSFLPGLLFVVSASFTDVLGGLSPVLLVNFLVIWLLNQFLLSYRRPDARSLAFDMGLLVGLGTIIYLPFLSFSLIIWLGLLIFRPFNWREWAMPLLGLATVVFFLWFYYYWNGASTNFSERWISSLHLAPFKALPYAVVLLAAGIGLLALVQLRTNFFRSVVHIRKSFQLLSALFGLVVLSANLSPGIQLNHYVLATVPVSVLMAYYFMHATKSWVYETIFIVMLGLILYSQLF